MAASITIYRLGEDASTGPERVVDLEAGVPTVDGLPDNAAADKLVSEAGWLRSGEWQVTSIGFHTDVVRSTDLHTTTWPDDLEAGPITGLSTERDGLWTAATAGPRGTTTAGGQGTTTEVQT